MFRLKLRDEMKKANVTWKLLGTVGLMELFLSGFNYFSAGGDYHYHWNMLNPFKAISGNIRFLRDIMEWPAFLAIIATVVLLIVLFVGCFFLSSIFVNTNQNNNES